VLKTNASNSTSAQRLVQLFGKFRLFHGVTPRGWTMCFGLFGDDCLSATLKMEAGNSSKLSVTNYQSKGSHVRGL